VRARIKLVSEKEITMQTTQTANQQLRAKEEAAQKLVAKFNKLYIESCVYLEAHGAFIDIKLLMESSLLDQSAYAYAYTNDHCKEIIKKLAAPYEVDYNNAGTTFWLCFPTKGA
jgi:predicted outer membrane protein